MTDTASLPLEDLIHDLTMSLWRSRGAIRDVARRKAWEPSIDDCRRIAERQVEQLKRHGVFRGERTVAPAHSMRPHEPALSPMALPVWRSRSEPRA